MGGLLKPLIEEEITFENSLVWLENLEEKSRGKDFQDYLLYLNTEGLNPDEAEAVKGFLGELCKKTGYIWRPALCRHSPRICKTANRILNSSGLRQYIKEVVTISYNNGDHYFLIAYFCDGKEFVIDATDVPVEEKGWVYPDDIKPYFGLVHSATGHHKIVYEGKELKEKKCGSNRYKSHKLKFVQP